MRFVLDTSVLVAAVRSPLGASNVLLIAALRQDFELLLSVPLFLEYESVLTRPEHLFSAGATSAAIQELLGTILDVAIPIHLGFFWPEPAQDKDDTHVLRLASIGRADALVTYNKRDFTPSASNLGINLETPAQAMRRMRL